MYRGTVHEVQVPVHIDLAKPYLPSPSPAALTRSIVLFVLL